MVRVFLRLEGLAVALCAVLAYAVDGGRWASFLIFLLLPDVLGLGPLAAALRRRPVPAGLFVMYNVTHAHFTPLVLGLLVWLATGALYWPLLGWVAHIGLDRALGYGLKLYPHFRRTHLQLDESPQGG